MKNTIVVGIAGAPGAGKSTGAAYVFSKLKMLGIDCELVTEFAKDKVWEENPAPFKNQAYMFGQQYYRISRCLGKVDVIVTDSPLPLGILYNTDPVLDYHFDQTVINVWKSLETMNYFLHRAKEYNPNGRNQTEEESNALSNQILYLYDQYGIPLKVLLGIEEHYNEIVDDVYAKVLHLAEQTDYLEAIDD